MEEPFKTYNKEAMALDDQLEYGDPVDQLALDRHIQRVRAMQPCPINPGVLARYTQHGYTPEQVVTVLHKHLVSLCEEFPTLTCYDIRSAYFDGWESWADYSIVECVLIELEKHVSVRPS
jgi:hypothetical protein